MKKFWRSGMIDKKIVREREQEEYINKLNRTILELRREPASPEPCCCKRPDISIQFADNWDEIRKGNGEVILDFYKPKFNKSKGTSVNEMLDWAAQHLRDHPHYDGDIEFWNKMEDKQR